MAIISSNDILKFGLGIALKGVDLRRMRLQWRVDNFKTHFGAHPYHVACIWRDLQTTNIAAARIDPGEEEKGLTYLFMALHILKCYKEEKEHASFFGRTDEKVVSRISWKYVRKIEALQTAKIVWPNIWGPSNFILTVDGTHCPIEEPTDPNYTSNKDYYSHKEHGPALNYEVALDLWRNRIVWIKGPTLPGEFNDLQVFRQELKAKIPPGKRLIGDEGYQGEDDIISTRNYFDSDFVKEFKARAKARHEKINDLIKRYECLEIRFRHDHEKHGSAFRAAAVLTSYEMTEGDPSIRIDLFDI